MKEKEKKAEVKQPKKQPLAQTLERHTYTDLTIVRLGNSGMGVAANGGFVKL